VFQEGGRRVKKKLLSNPQQTMRKLLRLPECTEVTMTLPCLPGRVVENRKLTKKGNTRNSALGQVYNKGYRGTRAYEQSLRE
jgi:hypothetical protein